MTQRTAKTLHSGDTFRRPSTNGHCKDGWRRYEVTHTDLAGMGIVDEFGYASNLPWGAKNGTAEFLANAEIVKVQQ